MIEGIFDIFFDFLTILKCKFKKMIFLGNLNFVKNQIWIALILFI